MTIRTRRWLVLVGVTLGIAAWVSRCLHRSFSLAGDSSSAGEFIDERHMKAFLVRRRIHPNRVEAIRDVVSKVVSEDDSDALLSLEGATTASLFLNRNLTDPELVWCVELPRTVVATWDDPEATVSAAFPLDHDRLVETGDAVEGELLVHAVNPFRPQVAAASGVESRPVSDSGSDRTADVALVSVWLDSGVSERLADWFAGLARWFEAGELSLGPIEEWSAEMIDVENMYTESVFLERSAEGYELLLYMEADEMQQVYDAYYDTWNPVARVSEIVLDGALRDSSAILDYPLETDFEPVAHAVPPNRPRRVADLSNHHG